MCHPHRRPRLLQRLRLHQRYADCNGDTYIDTGAVTLHARGYKIHGLQKVDLFWSGPSSGFIDIYRDSVLVATVAAQSGFYTDNINRTGKGTYVYRVCVAGTRNCSNQVTVKFGGGG